MAGAGTFIGLKLVDLDLPTGACLALGASKASPYRRSGGSHSAQALRTIREALGGPASGGRADEHNLGPTRDFAATADVAGFALVDHVPKRDNRFYPFALPTARVAAVGMGWTAANVEIA